MPCAQPRKRSSDRLVAAHITKIGLQSWFFSSLLVHKFDNGLSIVIPIRGAHRLENLARTINHINGYGFSNIEFIIVEESMRREIDPDAFVPFGIDFKYKYVSSTTRFNKSKAVNQGVLLSSFEHTFMSDADVVAPPECYIEMDSILLHYDAVFLLHSLYNVSSHKNGYQIKEFRNDGFKGGMIGFRKSKYLEIGGMCESFIGYGFEDNEFFERASAALRLYYKRKYRVLHWYHNPDSLQANRILYNMLAKMSMHERIDYCRRLHAEQR
ncbi:MAG: glycosyltransferase family 2 protein [Bradyrhizobiaceae bacterium]|nr:glycosyltransferase family 2 protein [Hyphomicrobiales bacterium]MBV9426542.1 glycosyltransferase family 2 protein [Bradyrhizobiaceae bacterium]